MTTLLMAYLKRSILEAMEENDRKMGRIMRYTGCAIQEKAAERLDAYRVKYGRDELTAQVIKELVDAGQIKHNPLPSGVDGLYRLAGPLEQLAACAEENNARWSKSRTPGSELGGRGAIP